MLVNPLRSRNGSNSHIFFRHHSLTNVVLQAHNLFACFSSRKIIFAWSEKILRYSWKTSNEDEEERRNFEKKSNKKFRVAVAKLLRRVKSIDSEIDSKARSSSQLAREGFNSTNSTCIPVLCNTKYFSVIEFCAHIELGLSTFKSYLHYRQTGLFPYFMQLNIFSSKKHKRVVQLEVGPGERSCPSILIMLLCFRISTLFMQFHIALK